MDLANIEIRPATEHDCGAIQELYSEQLEYHLPYDPKWNVSWPESPDARNRVLLHITDPNRILLVAASNARVVGYLQGEISPGHPGSYAIPVAELSSMHVTKDFRGKGIGRKLTENFIEFCKSSKVARIKVTAAAGNERTIEFYKTIGFKPNSSILVIDL